MPRTSDRRGVRRVIHPAGCFIAVGREVGAQKYATSSKIRESITRNLKLVERTETYAPLPAGRDRDDPGIGLVPMKPRNSLEIRPDLISETRFFKGLCLVREPEKPRYFRFFFEKLISGLK